MHCCHTMNRFYKEHSVAATKNLQCIRTHSRIRQLFNRKPPSIKIRQLNQMCWKFFLRPITSKYTALPMSLMIYMARISCSMNKTCGRARRQKMVPLSLMKAQKKFFNVSARNSRTKFWNQVDTEIEEKQESRITWKQLTFNGRRKNETVYCQISCTSMASRISIDISAVSLQSFSNSLQRSWNCQ